MEREQVVAIVLQAGTLEECRRARQVLEDWMHLHPNDYGMLDAGEALEMSCDESISAVGFSEQLQTTVV